MCRAEEVLQMLEQERDQFSNECIAQATKLTAEAKKMLLSNQLKEAILNNYNGIYTAMRAVLAIDDVFSENDNQIEKEFRTRYIDNGMMSEELVETLDKLTETYDRLCCRGDDVIISKPEAGYFTSKANFFVIEAADYIVQRNALTWGQ